MRTIKSVLISEEKYHVETTAPAIKSVLIIMVLFGMVFPLLITAIAKVAFPYQANGSLIKRDGKVIGSELIAQGFTAPGYFHPRPSAAGNGYDASNSGATNLGPTSDKLINGIHKKLPNGQDDPGNFDGIKDLAAAYRKENGLAPDAPVPADAVTRSASGLDPQISPANALLQVARVARTRGTAPKRRCARWWRAIPRVANWACWVSRGVNVLKLNLALDALKANRK